MCFVAARSEHVMVRSIRLTFRIPTVFSVSQYDHQLQKYSAGIYHFPGLGWVCPPPWCGVRRVGHFLLKNLLVWCLLERGANCPNWVSMEGLFMWQSSLCRRRSLLTLVQAAWLNFGSILQFGFLWIRAVTPVNQRLLNTAFDAALKSEKEQWTAGQVKSILSDMKWVSFWNGSAIS